jgi:hypothetical protein
LQVAAALLARDGGETRGVLLGVGFAAGVVREGSIGPEAFAGLVDGVLGCL